MEFELQTPVEINPQGTVNLFTCWVFDEPTTMANATR
jgi:hypothetical protein